MAIRHAAAVLRAGGVVAYPTEGVYGLGCIADDEAAVRRILRIKRRDWSMGLVVIVSELGQIRAWTSLPPGVERLESTDALPLTWILPATGDAPPWIRGRHDGLAVRQTTHPVARALCRATDSALVSTSANLSGHPPVRNRFVLRRLFGRLVDYIVPGELGPASGPSEIRNLGTGQVLRPA